MSLTGHDPNEPLPATWAARESVVQALWEVAADFEVRPDEWEHRTIAQYLEALGALLGSIEHAYANRGDELPTDPWIVIADAIRGAPYYE